MLSVGGKRLVLVGVLRGFVLVGMKEDGEEQ